MKNNYKILFLIIGLTFLITPLKSIASPLPDIMPDCDITVYEVEEHGTHNFDDAEAFKYNKAEEGGEKESDYERVCNGDCIDARNYVQIGDKGESAHDKYGDVTHVIDYNPCGFDDFITLLINAFQFGLTMLAVVVLFFFIWGGFGFIIAGGRTEKIQEAKKTIKGAFVGMLIVLCAWITVNFYIFAFTDDPQSKIFGEFWWGGSEECHEDFPLECDKNNLHLGCGGPKDSSTDTYIKDLQNALNNLEGCECGPVDGCYGDKTADCVIEFQLSNQDEIGNFEVGVVGENTWNAIKTGSGSCQVDYDTEKTEEAEYCCGQISLKPGPICLPTWEENGCDKYGENYMLLEKKKCSELVFCQEGCCIPDDLNKDCYNCTGNECLPYGDTFNHEAKCKEESNSEDCLWHICRENSTSVNNCYIQRGGCLPDVSTNEVAWSKEAAQEKMSTMDVCNMGTCTIPFTDASGNTYYDCYWESRSRCEEIEGEFYYKIPTPSSTDDTDSDGYANLNGGSLPDIECRVD